MRAKDVYLLGNPVDLLSKIAMDAEYRLPRLRFINIKL